MLLLLIFDHMHPEGSACSCAVCPTPQFEGLDDLNNGSKEIQHWRNFQDLNTSHLQGWSFFETSNAYRYSWICPFLHRNKQVHLTCENAVLVFSKNLSEFFAGKPYYSMNLSDAEIHVRPLYLQLQVKDSKKFYTIGFHSIKEFMFFIKSVKVQLDEKAREKELWFQRRISSLHRTSAMRARQQMQFCDETIYDLMRQELHTTRVVKSRGQNVFHLRTLARGWWPACCMCLAIGSCCHLLKQEK